MVNPFKIELPLTVYLVLC